MKVKDLIKISSVFSGGKRRGRNCPCICGFSQSNVILFSTLLCLVWLSSCKPAEVVRQDRLLPMPDTFAGTTQDTTASAVINWREYFQDPYLISLIDTALANNLDLRITWQRIEAAKAGVLAAKGALLPTVEAAASAGMIKFGRYTMDGAGNRNTEMIDDKDIPVHLPDFFAGLQSSWEVDIWGKLRNRRGAAVSRLLASIEGRNFVQTNLIAEVAVAYYELLALDAGLAIIDENIAIQENALELVRVQKEAGIANQLAVEQFEAQLLGLRGQRIEVEQLIVETQSYLNFLCGRYPQPVQRSQAEFLDTEPAPLLSGVPAQLLRNRPDIRSAEHELAASKADLNAARALFFPTVEIQGLLGFQAFRPGLLFTRPESFAYNFIGGLAAPLLNRRAIQAEFNAASAYQLEALYAYQETILDAYIEVHNGLAAIRNLERTLDLKRSAAEAFTRSIGTSNELFRTSRASYLEVLLAQQNALNARLDLVEVKKRQLQTGIGVYRALGGGWR